MLRTLLKQIIYKKKVTIFLMLVVMLFGIYSLYIVPKQEDPDINVSIALITAYFPGAAPETIERLVTQKIENVLPEIDGYDYSESYSKNSVAIIVVRLTVEADVDKSWSQLKDKLADLQPELPEGASEISLNTNLADTAGIILALSGEDVGQEELNTYAEDISKELSRIDGIARFTIVGKQENEIKVAVDIEKLNELRLSLADLINILKVQNTEIPAGAIRENGESINVNTSGSYSSIEDIQNTIIEISPETGQIIRLTDIAEIYLASQEVSYQTRFNGNEAILLTGYFKDNKNILLAGKDIEKKLDEIKQKLPSDITISEVLYQPDEINEAIIDFLLNLLIGIIIVIVVVFLSMGFRNAIIVSTAIPLSLLITFVMMYFLGIKIQQISITALIISLGMLVDNAIVISDAIQVRIDNNEDKLTACVEGTKEVAIPVLTSTLTTVFAFVPLLLLPGMAGEFINSLPKIIIIALTASYFVAMLVSPSMAYIFFRKNIISEKKFLLRDIFSNLLALGLKHQKTVVLITVLIFGGALYLTTLIGLQFFPKSDKNMLYINISTELPASFAKTEAALQEVEAIIQDQPEIISFTAAIGGGMPKFYFSVPPMANSLDTAQLLLRIDLDQGSFKSNTELANQLQIVLDERLSGTKAIVRELEQGEPIGAPIVVRISGEDLAVLQEAATSIEEILIKIPGTINVEDDIRESIEEYAVNIDQDQAASFGITNLDIQREINIALRGQRATVFRKATTDFNVVVESNLTSLSELESLAIKSTITGQKIQLQQIADLELIQKTPRIYKYDRERAVTVQSQVLPGYSSIDIQGKLQEQLKEADLQDVTIVYAGEKSKIIENFGGMGEAAIFIVFLIFTILLLQFNSIIQPLIIILTIPLAVIGSITGLYLFDQPLSFTSLLGMVSLMGIVVNNAIVLIDYINGQRKNGVPLEEASRQAAKNRFRPVMLTTFTTIIGLMPLVFSGSNLFVPLSISVISGLLISTLLTLVIIPVVYTLVERQSATNE